MNAADLFQVFVQVCWVDFFLSMLRRKEFCNFPPFPRVLGIFGGVTESPFTSFIFSQGRRSLLCLN